MGIMLLGCTREQMNTNNDDDWYTQKCMECTPFGIPDFFSFITIKNIQNNN